VILNLLPLFSPYCRDYQFPLFVQRLLGKLSIWFCHYYGNHIWNMNSFTVNMFPIWVYEEVDKHYLSIPGFSNRVTAQRSFSKERNAQIICWNLIKSSPKQLLGCKNAHQVIHQLIVLLLFACYFLSVFDATSTRIATTFRALLVRNILTTTSNDVENQRRRPAEHQTKQRKSTTGVSLLLLSSLMSSHYLYIYYRCNYYFRLTTAEDNHILLSGSRTTTTQYTPSLMQSQF
jgi:hypothetical protein